MSELATASTLTPLSQTPSPFDGASLPPSRRWLTSLTSAQQGLHLSHVLDAPRLFISDVGSAGDGTLLSQQKIGAILSLVPQPFEQMTLCPTPRTALERFRVSESTHAPYRAPNLHRYFISLSDDGNNTPLQLKTAFEVLNDICRAHRDTGILVHCKSGLSRSVSLVAAMIAKSIKCTFQEAAMRVAEHRPITIDEDLAVTLTQALDIPLDSLRWFQALIHKPYSLVDKG